MSLTTFRKTGVGVPTPVWFAEEDGKLYVITQQNSGKVKRIRNNSRVEIAPCTMRGKVTGPAQEAFAREISLDDEPTRAHADRILNRKYFLKRIMMLFNRGYQPTYLEIHAKELP
ncbi:MAG: PPOX class F420-dependent oxidoreductase [Anaerolineae bacterium]|nr:PPOX class F420-dependent oxidoreductase [Anaerolineae bacterium]